MGSVEYHNVVSVRGAGAANYRSGGIGGRGGSSARSTTPSFTLPDVTMDKLGLIAQALTTITNYNRKFAAER